MSKVQEVIFQVRILGLTRTCSFLGADTVSKMMCSEQSSLGYGVEHIERFAKVFCAYSGKF